jgi:DNA-binding NtrC family response regulator
MMAHERILVVDDDRAFRLATRTVLVDDGYTVTTMANGQEALEELQKNPYDLMLSDLVMGTMSGMALLREVRKLFPDLSVIMVTGFGSVGTAIEAIRLGAADYVTKPTNNDELLIKIRRVIDGRRQERELSMLREEVQHTYAIGNIVSRSTRMRDVIRLIKQVADTDVTVLIQGESGTGKELVAHALHFNSKRSSAPFIAVNCSALPENLLESELFGYEKGAFTGAMKQRAGRFEEANGGTLFLDEIGDISPAVQTKLLRVLQEKTFERVGGNAPLTVDTRVVVATNRNLQLMMRQGDFREDLYYRLNVFPIVLPPLRERLEDVPLLAAHFLERHADLTGGRVKHIAPEVITAMMNCRWRGNVRELENLMKRAIIKATGDTILSMEIPGEDGHAVPEQTGVPSAVAGVETPFKEYLGTIVRDAEEKYLMRMLRIYKGNINQIARLMDVDRKTVYRKMTEYGIDPEKFRGD